MQKAAKRLLFFTEAISDARGARREARLEGQKQGKHDLHTSQEAWGLCFWFCFEAWAWVFFYLTLINFNVIIQILKKKYKTPNVINIIILEVEAY